MMTNTNNTNINSKICTAIGLCCCIWLTIFPEKWPIQHALLKGGHGGLRWRAEDPDRLLSGWKMNSGVLGLIFRLWMLLCVLHRALILRCIDKVGGDGKPPPHQLPTVEVTHFSSVVFILNMLKWKLK